MTAQNNREKQKPKINKIALGFVLGCAGLIVLVIVLGIIGSLGSKKDNQTNSNSAQKTEQPATNTSTEPAVPELIYKEVTSWAKGDKTWHAIVFSRKPTNDELIKAAKELHSKNKTDYYDFFDDDSQIEAFKNWDINYAETTSTTDFPYPEEWANAHNLGLLNEMYNRGNMEWTLTSAAGENLAIFN